MTVHFGDCREVMRGMVERAEKVQMCVTSPPYFGLRDYGLAPTEWPAIEFSPMPGLPAVEVPAMSCCLGLEPDPWAFVGHLVAVFREVRRVLRDDGTLWLNLGDSYAGSWGSQGRQGNTGQMAGRAVADVREKSKIQAARIASGAYPSKKTRTGSVDSESGLKPKDMMGIPWRVALALQDDGWYLRQDIIWHKPNPMPESVRDRCTKAHEYLFLLSKSAHYHFDAAAIREQSSCPAGPGNVSQQRLPGERAGENSNVRGSIHKIGPREFRNKRSVWTVATKPFKGAHFATFPPDLIEPCILAGSRPGDTVLDPFYGSGTTGQVCNNLGRKHIGIELNRDYEPLQIERTAQGGLLL